MAEVVGEINGEFAASFFLGTRIEKRKATKGCVRQLVSACGRLRETAALGCMAAGRATRKERVQKISKHACWF